MLADYLQKLKVKMCLLLHLPAVDHEFVYFPGASRGWGLEVPTLYELEDLVVGMHGEWFLTNRPYLKQHHCVAPYITVCRVLLVQESLHECMDIPVVKYIKMLIIRHYLIGLPKS